MGELSIQRLGTDGCVLGKPKRFKEVLVSDENALEPTGFIARGYITGETMLVLKYQDNGKVHYLVKSSEKENTYWLVKHRPESLREDKPEFILEPSSDFLLKHKQDKLSQTNSDESQEVMERKAEENRALVRRCFEVNCAAGTK